MARRGWRAKAALRVGLGGSVLAAAALTLLADPAFAVGKVTTTTVTATSPAFTGEPITFTATVTHNSAVPTGTVTFTITGADSSTPSCDGGNTATLSPATSGSGAVAQCTISAGLVAAASPYAVTAVYSGDDTYAPSTGTLSKVIHLGPTTTVVTSSSNPTVTGQAVSFSAVVNATSPATGAPTGSVTFSIVGAGAATASCDGGDVQPLSGDVATCPVSGGLLASGSPYSVTATYSGDANYATSTGTVTQGVARAAVTIGVTSSSSSVVSGQPISFTATILSVSPPGSGAPTGNVVFSVVGSTGTTITCDGGATVSLAGSSAQCNFSAGLLAKPLSYTVSATLSDPNFKSPAAGTLVQQVSKAATTTSLSGLPGSLVAAQSFTFTITAATGAPGSGVPQGVVEWSICPDPGTGVCSGYPGGAYVLPAPTANEIANSRDRVLVSVPGGLSPGFYAVSASYEGTANLQPSISASGHILVTKVPTTMNLALNHNPVPVGSRLVIKAAIIADQRATDALGAPQGTVTFTITGMSGDTLTCNTGSNVISISTNSLNQGVAKCVIDPSQLTSTDAPYQIQAAYPGDANYDGVTGGPVNVGVEATS